jgi:hypothetical protein
MLQTEFTTEVLDAEVVVKEVTDGHVFHFPILSNGTVSLHGSRIKHNPTAKREASRSLFEAYNAARVAFGHSRSPDQKERST